MRWSVVACLLAATTGAAAGPDVLPLQPWPATRKPASATNSTEALEMFVDAIIADKAGDLSRAMDRYQRMVRLAKDDPNALYNLADVQRRLEHYYQAVESYKKYLALVPDAPDRKEVARIIDLIEKRPSFTVIDGEDLDAIVLVDGALIGPSPAHVFPTPGGHTADRIGPTSYRHERFYVPPAHTDHVHMNYEEAEGNVVMSGSSALPLAGTWVLEGHKFTLPGRFTLPPGRYQTYVRSEAESCNRISFDVAKGDVITYVYVDLKPGQPEQYCKPLTVKVQKLRLPS
ncbi:MAG: Tetratricopeptide repeat [Myxococcales bacterium]|nr:Tetratricopeptide repeat [Myxococcales bacterium]